MSTELPIDPSDARLTDERFLRQIFVRDQMSEWSRDPLVMAAADGLRYRDVHGREYLDALSGIYVCSVGHRNRRVIDAYRAQLERLDFSPPMHGTNPLAIRLANRLAEIAPGDLSAVKLATSGSEATEAAIKMARQYHRLRGNSDKYKVISRYSSWHGSTMASLSASGLKSRKTVNEPLAPGFVHVFPPTCYRCPFGKRYPDCALTCATIIEDVIRMEDPATVAAIIVEPIGHTGGIIDPPPEYLPLLREMATRHDVLLIFDEIITGIGRTGEWFAAQTFGVTPDILCAGKGLSGGYAPLSALICRRGIADTFWGPIATNPGFVEGHTYEGHPPSCAAALAVLDEIAERDLLANARAQGARLRAGLESIAAGSTCIGDLRGKGLLQGVELVRDRETRVPFGDDIAFGTRVGRRMLSKGLLARFDPHWIAFGPPLIVEAADVDRILEIFAASLREVARELGT